MANNSAEKAAWIGRVLGVVLDEGMPDGRAGTFSLGANLEAAIEGWATARAMAVATLTKVETAVRKSLHPDRDKAVIILRSVRANLSERPDTMQKVSELRDYLAKDDVVDAAETPNIFGIRVALKTPLLQALEPIRIVLQETAR